MVAIAVFEELQVAYVVRFCGLPSTSIPDAVNCFVVPFAMLAVAGDVDRDATCEVVSVAELVREEMPYVATLSAGSYIDLMPEGAAACGTLPEVCLKEFRSYTAANDPSDAAVFEQLATAAEASPQRVFEANNLVDARPHVFLGPTLSLEFAGTASVSGCATEIQVKGRPSIYSMRSITIAAAAP